MSPIRKTVIFSSSYRKEELCYCTEELGSESISNACSTATVMPATPTVLEMKGGHGLEAKGDLAKGDGDFGELTDEDSYGTVSSATAANSRLSTHVRTFPPPLLSDRPLMKSFKSNGRFVLQRVDRAATSTFRVIREDGRLRFELITSPNYWPLAEEEEIDEDYEEKTSNVSETKLELEVLFSSKGEKRWANVCRVPRNMKLFSYWNTASKCLPTLDFLIMTQKLNNMQASACSSYERWEQSNPKLGTNLGSNYMQEHLGTNNYMQKSLQKSKKKHTISISSPISQQGYAIISWKLGLIFLLLESSSVGGFNIKGVYYYNYTKLEGKIKGSLQHDLVSNFSCVKEESLKNY